MSDFSEMKSTAIATRTAGMVDSDGWQQVSAAAVGAGERIHVRVDGRYVTVFNRAGSLHCIDSMCHHAGGPLTEGALRDIEDLHTTVVLCPWHQYMVTLDGKKVFQAVSFGTDGKPQPPQWTLGKQVQRAHDVQCDAHGTYVRVDKGCLGRGRGRGGEEGERGPGAAAACGSDEYALSDLCGGLLELHPYAAHVVDRPCGAQGQGQQGEEEEEEEEEEEGTRRGHLEAGTGAGAGA